ncbi:MAG: 7-cyano-7-deazaguanine synthase QueC [Candidatus Hydrogenedentes bacterium]|nr:7-cyano-7-deazaguanine synthase QueC [Candidatus Hydrogenedentota bacterium]
MTTIPCPTAVALLSGGLDSTVLLHHARQSLVSGRVLTLSYNYGQRHTRELDCARWQAERVGAVEHRVIDLSFLGELLRGGSALIAGGHDVPNLTDLAPEQLTQPPTYVPNRNMMLLSMAAAYAEASGVRDVFYGAQAMDQYGYWDCTVEFVERINRVLSLNRNDPITIHAPFVTMKKTEVVKLGLSLGVDFSHTWSCYRGESKACGTCPTCVERLTAFREAGIPDPVPYA